MMISYMLNKLEGRMRQAVCLQQEGRLPEALAEYELIFETLYFYEKLGYAKETQNIQRLALEAQPDHAMALYCHGLALYHRKQFQSALYATNAAISLVSDLAPAYILKTKAQVALGDLQSAVETNKMAEQFYSSRCPVEDNFFMIAVEKEMPGMDYYDWLQRFHQWLKPASYIEIGLGHGRSLALAEAGTKAIGIDPYQGYWEKLNYVSQHAPASLFPLTSDDFFAKYDITKVIAQNTFDLAFIDGLHLFEQALKDFINLEKYARKGSVILIHDCLPIVPIVAERNRCTGFWTGDVWRLIPCLKVFRPDLKIMTIPTKPSGLGVVTNLDATSTLLADNYDQIVRYYLTLKCPENFAQQRIVCSVGVPDEEAIKGQFCTN